MSERTDAANAEERIARIEKMVADLAAIEEKAEQLAAEAKVKAATIAAELAALKARS